MSTPGWVGTRSGMSGLGQGSAAVLALPAVKQRGTNKAAAAIANYDMPEFHNCVGDWERKEYFEFL
ncbi:MAG: hypothetical protein JO251_02360 [Verrucomicrobia bacterium]|nr:hypothetical protein [Verrucomicrobiota bacterium]